jgi:hypothetical protein
LGERFGFNDLVDLSEPWLIVAAEESDDGHGTFMARSADGVPRKPVHGRHEAADAAIHASSLTTASSPPPFSLWLCNDAKNELFAIAFVLCEGIKMNGERGEDDVLLPFLFLKRACMRWLLRNQGNIKFLPSLKQSCLVVINV